MKTKITLLIALLSWFLNLGSIQAQTPEILHYNFNGVGTTVPNLALTPPVGAENATIMGGVTLGGVGQCETTALVGSGIPSSTDYLNTNWNTNLGTTSWTISFWSSGFSNAAALYYIFGDTSANSFRCFTNGVAGANNWILRGGGLTDIYLNGGAIATPTMNTFVYDNVTNTVKAYLNGVLVNTVAQTTPNIVGSSPLKVMGYGTNIGAPSGGMLDDFRIYNRALTDTEVLNLSVSSTLAPIVTTPITYLQGETATPLTATGTGLLWYTSSIGGIGDVTAPTPSTATVGTTSYWVSQTSTCGEGPRAQIDVEVLVGQASALHFDGSNDYVAIGNSMNTVLAPLNTITVEAWVNAENTTFNGVIAGNYYSWNNEMQFLLRRDFDTFSFWVNDGTGFKAVDSGLASVTINTWQHVAGVWDGSSLYIYVDGVLKGTTTGVTGSNFAYTSNSVVIGSNGYPEPFGGSIDELRIWTRALNQCEIQNNMNGELLAGQTGLLAYYQFNQGIASADNTAITSLTDSSGNNYNGSLVNFALTGTTSNWVNPGGITTGTTSPTYTLPNVNAITNQELCNNTATTPIVFSSSTTGTLCGEVNENNNIALTAPTGTIFTSIPFASYGTPDGSCGSYTLGSCHASNSVSVVSGLALGQNSFSFWADNGMFGDPCAFTTKRMYIQAVYDNTTYNWTNDTPSIGLAASGSGNIPSFTGANTGSTPIVATITVTPMVNGCNGTPIQFTITVNQTPTAPIVASQEFCDSATVADIAEPGLNWYDVATNGTVLTASTSLMTGIYYVSQTINTCESPRTLVSVTITPSTTNATTATSCDSYVWAVNGTTYNTSGNYTSVNGCHTETLDLTINSSATPTGSSTQVINGGIAADATIEDIVVNPTTVIWYASSSDALAGINALPAGTQLVDGTEYFAVNYENGCSSTPFAVTISVVLGNDDFDSVNFSVYPNPTSDVVTLKYSNEISEVSVINLLGQTLLNKKLNTTEAIIDLSNLPSATYIVKVVSEGKIKIVKVIKR